MFCCAMCVVCSQRLGDDARLTSSEFDWIREEWTHEQIMDLIVGSGKFVHPDKVQVFCTLPLALRHTTPMVLVSL